jgi:hypothetical protein
LTSSADSPTLFAARAVRLIGERRAGANLISYCIRIARIAKEAEIVCHVVTRRVHLVSWR